MFRTVLTALAALLLVAQFRAGFLSAEELPKADSLIARSNRIRDNLTYYGVSERRWSRGEQTSTVKRIVWRQAAGPVKYRFENRGQEVTMIIRGDSSFVSPHEESPDGKDKKRKYQDRFRPGTRSFQNLELLKRNYNLILDKGDPVAGRSTWRLEIRRRSDDKVVEKTWFDRDTGLILARQRWNSEREPIYSLRFETIEYRDGFDPEVFDTAGLAGRPRRQSSSGETETADAGRVASLLRRIDFPGGFEPVKTEIIRHHGWPMLHASLTDGLRSLSVFARRTEEKDEEKPSYQRWGAVTVQREIKGEIKYTLVGELAQHEMEDIMSVLPPELPLPDSPGRIPRLIALIAFALAVVSLSIVILKRLKK